MSARAWRGRRTGQWSNATVFADTRWTAEQWLASFVNDTTSVDSLAFGSPGRGLHVGDPLSHSAS